MPIIPDNFFAYIPHFLYMEVQKHSRFDTISYKAQGLKHEIFDIARGQEMQLFFFLENWNYIYIWKLIRYYAL